MKKIISLLIISLVFIHLQAVVASAFYDVNSPEVRKIADQLSMQGHENHDIATCTTMQSYYEDIIELLNEGKTEEEIVDYYYNMYGEAGLRAPKKEGFSLLAWVTPFIALSVAGVGVVSMVQRTVKRNRGIEITNETEDSHDEVENEILKSIIEEVAKKTVLAVPSV
ncbi:MAG: cytochrome c-type biogenesis protein CcmH [Bacillus sp. (in: Bacteria)]|nr:cytochrome c-type biogenesis protein CcmH [Bacillus sp. (in: firmicutes)]